MSRIYLLFILSFSFYSFSMETSTSDVIVWESILSKIFTIYAEDIANKSATLGKSSVCVQEVLFKLLKHKGRCTQLLSGIITTTQDPKAQISKDKKIECIAPVAIKKTLLELAIEYRDTGVLLELSKHDIYPAVSQLKNINTSATRKREYEKIIESTQLLLKAEKREEVLTFTDERTANKKNIRRKTNNSNDNSNTK